MKITVVIPEPPSPPQRRLDTAASIAAVGPPSPRTVPVGEASSTVARGGRCAARGRAALGAGSWPGKQEEPAGPVGGTHHQARGGP